MDAIRRPEPRDGARLEDATAPASSHAPFSIEAQSHTLTFLPAGPDRLQALIALIDRAERSLKMCFYIFAEDASGAAVRSALVAAARRGVSVSLIVDGFGADADGSFFAEMIAAGGRYCCFSPRWNQRYLIRNHQKIVVADGTHAMLGGFNVEDDYFAPPGQGWEDLGFTIDGPLVARVEHWFDGLEAWARKPHARFKDMRRLVREWDPGKAPVQLLIGGPTRGLSSWASCAAADFDEGDRLSLVMGYFSPPRRALRHIEAIAAKGQTRLLFPAKSDNNATIGASRALYGRLLRAGARIWEFSPTKLHTKLIVLDDAIYVGSANFDMRSLYLNLEIMVRIEDRALAQALCEYVEGRIAESQEITPAIHDARATLWNRIRWRAAWVLVAVLDYTISRRLNFGL